MQFFLWSTAAVLNAALAIFIFCLYVSGESGFRAVGFGSWLKKRGQSGLWLPKGLTSLAMVAFLILSLYCLAAVSGWDLPALRIVLISSTLIFLLRASLLLFDRVINPPLPTSVLISSCVALLIGGLQGLGLISMALFG